MESAVQSAWAMSIGVMSLGPYLFLAVYVGIKIWARTKEKLAVQETLRRLIESGTPVTPEVIEALRPMRGRTPQEVARSIKRWRYWGVFTIGLGIVLSLLTLFAEEPRTSRGLT